MRRSSTCSRRCRNFPAFAPIRKPSSRRSTRCSRASIRFRRRRRRIPTELSLTVDAVRYQIDGRTRLGVCSTWLGGRVRAGRQNQSLRAEGEGLCAAGGPVEADHHDRSGHRHRAVPRLPARAQATKAPGRNWLFFGHQQRDYDFFYEDELTAMRASGLLTRLTLAWSRDAKEKIYVQHRMREVGRDLWAWINDGAHIYVCGDALSTWRRTSRRRSSTSSPSTAARARNEAKAFVAEMKAEGPLPDGRLLGREEFERESSNAHHPNTPAAAWRRWRGCRCFSRWKASARVVAGGTRGGGLEGGAFVGGRARASMCMPTNMSDEMSALALDPPRGSVVLHARQWSGADLNGAAIAIGAFEDEEDAAALCSKPRALPACRSMSSTGRHSAISLSAPSSIARRWWSASRPTAPRRCSRKRSAPRSRRCCRKVLPLGRRPRGRWRGAVKTSGLLRRAPQVLAALHGARGRASAKTQPAQADFERLLAEAQSKAPRSSTAPSRWLAPGPAIRNC